MARDCLSCQRLSIGSLEHIATAFSSVFFETRISPPAPANPLRRLPRRARVPVSRETNENWARLQIFDGTLAWYIHVTFTPGAFPQGRSLRLACDLKKRRSGVATIVSGVQPFACMQTEAAGGRADRRFLDMDYPSDYSTYLHTTKHCQVFHIVSNQVPPRKEVPGI